MFDGYRLLLNSGLMWLGAGRLVTGRRERGGTGRRVGEGSTGWVGQYGGLSSSARSSQLVFA